MYRVLILVSAFLLAVAGMLYLQGGSRDPSDFAATDAPAALSDVAALSAPANTPAPTAPGTGANALAAAVAVGAPQAPDAAPDDSLQALTSNVLADLGVATGTAATPEAAANDPMAAMTANVLAGLGRNAAPASADTTPQPQNLQGIVVQALREGQSDAYIDALLNEAALAGQVAVPAALMTADGRVDTNTLLASIVARATAETDALTAQLAAEARGNAPAAAPRTAAAPANASTGPQTYVVEAGDSLAYISVLFYGTPAKFTQIFEANRDTISSPNTIKVGQTLRIPG